jgi:hypothetical protein
MLFAAITMKNEAPGIYYPEFGSYDDWLNAGRLTLDPVFPNQLNSCKSMTPVLGPVLLTCEPVAGDSATNT